MTQDEIIQMARDAGCLGPSKGGDPCGLWEPNGHENVTELMTRFAAIVADKEREACAKLAQETICDTHIPTGINIYGTRVAKAIRARSNHGQS